MRRLAPREARMVSLAERGTEFESPPNFGWAFPLVAWRGGSYHNTEVLALAPVRFAGMPDASSRPFKKLLVANRSEIAIRVFRSAHELGIRTVAIYSHEDRFALHRFKADEAYRVGKPGEPIRAYLDIANIVQIARDVGVDAIHP